MVRPRNLGVAMNNAYAAAVDILRNKKTGKFLIQQVRENQEIQGTEIAVGAPIVLDEPSMRREGLNVILKCLEECARSTKLEEAPRVTSRAEQGRFMARHALVAVQRIGEDEIELDPHEHRTGYRGSLPEDTIRVSLALTPEEFYLELMKAFERCM